MNDAYHLLVLFGSLALLMFLVVRGKSIFVVAPLCALLAVTLSGEDPVAKMNGAYMSGFADYVKKFYLIFALGAVFGKLMEDSGAAITVAQTVGKLLGKERACLAVVPTAVCRCLSSDSPSIRWPCSCSERRICRGVLFRGRSRSARSRSR
ncbi:MAG: yxjC [Planctomycetota bacterium]|nr:MAG: yxjC [Planctomycetota bacterium]